MYNIKKKLDIMLKKIKTPTKKISLRRITTLSNRKDIQE